MLKNFLCSGIRLKSEAAPATVRWERILFCATRAIWEGENVAMNNQPGDRQKECHFF